MKKSRPTPTPELPSTRALIKSTAIAATTAAVLLVIAVLPAEYGVDPTGIGRVLGLTRMGEIKMALAAEARGAEARGPGTSTASAPPKQAPAPDAPAAVAASGGPTRDGQASAPPGAPDAASSAHVTRVTLKPNEGKEVKLLMRKDARVTYEWSTDRGEVSYDTHGDQANPSRYHSYGKAKAASEKGEIVAAFDGMHGWFWRNRTKDLLIVTVRTQGDYQELKELP